MTADQAVELCQHTLFLTLTLAGPVLLAALVIGIVVGMLQTVTQMHDHSIGFVPKTILLTLVILFVLPWGLDRLTEYATDLIREIPDHIGHTHTIAP